MLIGAPALCHEGLLAAVMGGAEVADADEHLVLEPLQSLHHEPPGAHGRAEVGMNCFPDC